MAIDDSLDRARLHPDVLKNLNKNKKLKAAEAYSEDNPPPYPVTSVNNKTGAVTLGKSNVGLGNVDNVKQYSSSNPPPYPVTSVNGQTGAVTVPTVTLPLAVSEGGTGASTAASARANLNVPSVSEITAAQTYTINGVAFIFRRYGKVVVVTTSGTLTDAVSTSAYMGNVQVAESYRPITTEIRYIQVTPVATIQFNLSTNGTFQVGYAYPEIAAGVALRGTFVYMAAG